MCWTSRLVLMLVLACPTLAKAEEASASYFCTSEFAGGISYDAQSKSWRGTTFNTKGDNFVLSLKTERSRFEGKEFIEELTVTVTKAGSSYAAACLDFTGPLHSTVTSSDGFFRCSANVTDYTFSRKTNRFLSVYSVGYVTGSDDNENTPSVVGGTCTKIK
jgi:hypothetical protein